MKKKFIVKLILLIVLCCFFQAKAIAQEKISIDLDQAVEMAVQESEDYKLSVNEVIKRNQQYRQSKSAIYPRLNADISWLNNFEYPNSVRKTTRDYSFDAGVSVSQLVWSFGKVSSAIRFARQYENIGRLEQEAAKEDIVYATKINYFSALLAQDTHGILAQSLENARENKILLEKRSSSGRSPRRDLIKMEADIASRIPSVNEARAGLNSAIRSLKVITGISATDKVELADINMLEKTLIKKEKYIASLNANEPTIKALESSLKAQDEVIKIRRAGYYPTISAFASWDEMGISDDADLYNGNADGYGVAGVKVSVPLWTGGQTASELEQARIDKRSAKLVLQKTKKQFSLNLENALSEYQEYIKTLEANIHAVELAKESFELTRDMFTTGKVTLADLNDAELMLTGELLNKQVTLYNLNLTKAKIERLAGMK